MTTQANILLVAALALAIFVLGFTILAKAEPSYLLFFSYFLQ
jgi:hypothetical protein